MDLIHSFYMKIKLILLCFFFLHWNIKPSNQDVMVTLEGSLRGRIQLNEESSKPLVCKMPSKSLSSSCSLKCRKEMTLIKQNFSNIIIIYFHFKYHSHIHISVFFPSIVT